MNSLYTIEYRGEYIHAKTVYGIEEFRAMGAEFRTLRAAKAAITRKRAETALKDYLECARWTDREELGDAEPSPEWLRESRELVRGFLSIPEVIKALDSIPADQLRSIGHDLWLTSAGHGAGFWDRGYGEAGSILTKWAKTFRTELYVGDDGLIYSI
jgi:hypothetical protein